MTVRNISIVFSPTLNVPANVLSIFMSEYGSVFDGEPIETPIDDIKEMPQISILRANSKLVGMSEIPTTESNTEANTNLENTQDLNL